MIKLKSELRATEYSWIIRSWNESFGMKGALASVTCYDLPRDKVRKAQWAECHSHRLLTARARCLARRRFRRAGVLLELRRPKLGKGTEFTPLGQKTLAKSVLWPRSYLISPGFWERCSLKCLLDIDAQTNSGSDSGRAIPTRGREGFVPPHFAKPSHNSLSLGSAFVI